MVKKFFIFFILAVFVFSFCGCSPRTGEAKIKMPSYCEYTNGIYRIALENKDLSINFRECVKVNKKTTWVLSRNKDGSNPITTYTVSSSGTYYVVCFDRIGYSNCYEIEILYEVKTKHIYYRDFKNDEVIKCYEERFKQLNSNSGGLGSWSYANMMDFVSDFIWRDIVKHYSFGGSNEFFAETTGSSFTDDDKYHPTKIPKKTGYTFICWKQEECPGEIKVPSYYSEGYLCTLWTPVWERNG